MNDGGSVNRWSEQQMYAKHCPTHANTVQTKCTVGISILCTAWQTDGWNRDCVERVCCQI